MPGPALVPFHSDPALPDRVEVVVIGGGIIGACTALELAERGVSVLLCEKGEIGGEQSSRNWGWVRMSCRDPREIPLMHLAQQEWERMDARTGRRTGFTKSGILFGAENEGKLDGFTRWARHLEPWQIPHDILRGEALGELLPACTRRLAGALHTPGDGRAEPQWAAPAIAEAARDAGAHVVTGCAVRALDIRAGRVAGVVTERARVACEAAVLAAGAWSRLFAWGAGVELPQLKVLNSVMRTTPVQGGPETALWTDDLALRKRADGGYTLASGALNLHDIVPDSFRLARAFWPAFLAEREALRFRLSGRWWTEAAERRRWSAEEETPFERCRVLDPAPSDRLQKEVWTAARAAFPVFQQARVAQGWAGMIDVTPDAIPVISPAEDLPGLVISTGYSGHGFGIAPGAGRLTADLVTGAAPCVDPADFRLSRFSDGSRLQLMAEF